jgi:hypothetical protein
MFDIFHTDGRLVYHALLLFVVGLFAGGAVVRLGLTPIARPALIPFRWVMRLIGRAPSIARMTLVIWLFNSTAIFVYMSSGALHRLLPMVFCVWTGLNIAAIVGLARTGKVPARDIGGGEGQWTPPRLLAGVCGLAVLVLELGSFWTAIAMGISTGQAVQSGAGRLSALAPRAEVYVTILVPVLLVSAWCESVSIRGSSQEG